MSEELQTGEREQAAQRCQAPADNIADRNVTTQASAEYLASLGLQAYDAMRTQDSVKWQHTCTQAIRNKWRVEVVR